jgi:hypothetical protein
MHILLLGPCRVQAVNPRPSGHQTAIAIFRKEQSAGSNPAVKTYAARYVPMLQTHLRLAEHAESVLHVPATR